MRPRVKICCIQDEQEVAIAVAAGADLVGLVGRGLSGPEVIDDDDRIGQIAASVPPGVTSVLLTRVSDPAELAAQVRRTGVGMVQICDAVPVAAYHALRDATPNVRVVQVVHVHGPEAEAEAVRLAPLVDALLLDSGSPAGPAPVFGGTGLTHDWDISARIVRAVDAPVFLAGGLRATNVAQAMRQVRPFGLDLCSGVRTDGRLDPGKVEAFLQAVSSG